jgi:hypothetical protein
LLRLDDTPRYLFSLDEAQASTARIARHCSSVGLPTVCVAAKQNRSYWLIRLCGRSAMEPACYFLPTTRINCRSGSSDPVAQRGTCSKLKSGRDGLVGVDWPAHTVSQRGKFGRRSVTGWRLREELLAARRGELR